MGLLSRFLLFYLHPRTGVGVLLLTCGLIGGYGYNGGALSGRMLITPETLNYC